MPRLQAQFIADVQAECGGSHPAWLARFHPPMSCEVEIPSKRFVANGTERALIQNLGNAFGCHTCNRMIEDTPPRFIVDHIPPRQMMGSMNHRSRYRYFPHCDSCASEQSALVRKYAHSKDPQDRKIRDTVRRAGADPTDTRLKAAKLQLAKLGMDDPKERMLLCGGKFDRSIPGRYGDPSPAERKEVNAKGSRHGCHSCRTSTPMLTYHADHCPPAEFGMTAWFPALMAQLGAPLPRNWSLRPQCPDCSHKQGARCRALVAEGLKDFLPGSGVIRY